MITITPNQNAQAFTAVKFKNKSGRKFFENAISDSAQREAYISRQKTNKTSHISVKDNKVFVKFDNQKWQIVNSITRKNEKNNTFSEVIMLMARRLPLFEPESQTLFRKGGLESSDSRYGANGKLFAIAEDLANFEANHNEPKPTLLNKITSIFKS